MNNNKNYKSISREDIVRNLRKYAGYTQEQLAEKIECSSQTISNIECGKGISADIAIKLSKVFNVPAAYILGEIDRPDEYVKQTIESISLMARTVEAQETIVEYLIASEGNRRLKLSEEEKQLLKNEILWYGRVRLQKIIRERSDKNRRE